MPNNLRIGPKSTDDECRQHWWCTLSDYQRDDWLARTSGCLNSAWDLFKAERDAKFKEQCMNTTIRSLYEAVESLQGIEDYAQDGGLDKAMISSIKAAIKHAELARKRASEIRGY